VTPNPTLESHLEDDNLISSGLQGNREAFNVLFSRYRQLLYRLAYRVLHNHEEAEDAVQNTFLLAYSKLEGFKHDGAFRSWLVRILINEAVTILRGKKNRTSNSVQQVTHQQEADPFDSVPHPGPNPEQLLANKQSAIALARLVRQLCPLQRSTLMLRDFWEYTTEEASTMLNVTPTAIRTRLFRARKQLAAALRPTESVVVTRDVSWDDGT
jgi:RNA polymerase sigma-70 factor, ECF subfamily